MTSTAVSQGTAARPRRALVVGSSGLVGMHLLAALKASGWQTVGVARSEAAVPDIGEEPGPSHRHLQLDLLDAAACRRALEPIADEITHVFFAARASYPDPVEESRANLAMLVHVLDALERSDAALSHVCLVHGTKWYGSHLGPYPTPAREDDPRCIAPVFYYAQHDEVERRQRGRRWSWSTVRPHIVLGAGARVAFNCVALIGAYGALCRATGTPLSFPGSRRAFESISQATDADLLAAAMIWSAEDPRAANQDFNVINGDYFRWSGLWARLAEFFGVTVGPVRPMSLARELSGAGPLWDRLVAEHGLQPLPLARLANWNFADFLFAATWDDMSSTVKLRTYGFHATVSTEDSFLRHLGAMRAARLIP